MSHSLAQAWIRSLILGEEAQDIAVRFVDKLTADGLTGMLFAGPRRTVTGQCLVARWDGSSLTVIELTPKQQKCFAVPPGDLFTRPVPRLEFQEFQPLERFALLDVRFEHADALQSRDRMRGTFVVEIDHLSPWQPDFKPVLEIAFFHPQMSRPPHHWLVDRLLFKKQTTVPFDLTPMSPAGMPAPPILGTVLLYLRLLTRCSFGPVAGFQRASNVVAVPIEMI